MLERCAAAQNRGGAACPCEDCGTLFVPASVKATGPYVCAVCLLRRDERVAERFYPSPKRSV